MLVVRVESLRKALGRGAQELAPQVVGPGVIGADDGARAHDTLALPAQGCAAMTAGVMERLQCPVIAANQPQFLIAQLEGAEGPQLRHFPRAADIDPVSIP